MEHIGNNCFCCSSIEEVTLPSTLKEIDNDAFCSCSGLKIVWVGEDCAVDVRKYVDDSVTVWPTGTMVGDKLLRDLRGQKHLVIPEGLQKIGEKLFWYSDIESVTIPVSITTIEEEAFTGCESLREVVFENGSKLRTICANAFGCCGKLKNMILPEGLEKIDLYAFRETGLEDVELPASLRTMAHGAFAECN